MAEASDAFYVVRKGDIVGIYKKLSDCQAQVSSSVCGPPVNVYKGYFLPKKTEDYLASHGFKDALYSMHAAHLKDDMFDTVAPCPFQQPDRPCLLVDKKTKRSMKAVEEEGIVGSVEIPTRPAIKHFKMVPTYEAPLRSNIKQQTCILEFHGASKGNPGNAGAGAVLKTEDGIVVSCIREGLGTATAKVAEYRALILGLKYALMKGFKHIRVQGDSQLVCMQVQDLWHTKNQTVNWCEEAQRLKDMFQSFVVVLIGKEFNSRAVNLANLAIDLPAGEVRENCGWSSELGK